MPRLTKNKLDPPDEVVTYDVEPEGVSPSSCSLGQER